MSDPFEDERDAIRLAIVKIQRRYHDAMQAEIAPLVKRYASLPPEPYVIALNAATSLQLALDEVVDDALKEAGR